MSEPVNGKAPGVVTTDADVPEAVTSGEKIMAGLAILFAVMIALIGVDMLTGGKVTGMVRKDEPGDG